MLNLDAINHEFPGGNFLISKDINELINNSTGMIDNDSDGQKYSHQIFSMIALNSIGYSLEDLFKFLKYDISKGPMLGECNVIFFSMLEIDKNYKVSGKIRSIEFKKSKKIGEIDIVKFNVYIHDDDFKLLSIEYKLILPR